MLPDLATVSNAAAERPMADPRLKQKLDAGEFIVAPGVFDMISAMLAERVGFDAVYASGFWLTASHLGIPDAGLATYTDMLSRIAKVVEKSSAPVIADADTGFGGLLNVQHTVRGYERAGVSAIQIEDQEFPKKCGHTPYRRVIPLEDMVAKVRVAVDSRSDPNFLVIARTDARTGLGFDEAVRRGAAYAEAGADLVFVESLQSEEEMRRACSLIRAPMMANMSDGGKTPSSVLTIFAAWSVSRRSGRSKRSGRTCSANDSLRPRHSRHRHGLRAAGVRCLASDRARRSCGLRRHRGIALGAAAARGTR